MFVRILSSIRYVVVVPIVGLFVGALVMFLAGGYGMLAYVIGLIQRHGLMFDQEYELTFRLMEFVEEYLTGTVLVIMGLGLYQLFIRDLRVPEWLKIEDLEDLKKTLIGVVVAVLAIKFLGAALEWDHVQSPLELGAGMGVMVVALAVFLGVQAFNKRMAQHRHGRGSKDKPAPTLAEAGEDQHTDKAWSE